MNPHILRYNVTLHSDSIHFNLYNEYPFQFYIKGSNILAHFICRNMQIVVNMRLYAY
jgi:hypothetical protein